VNDVLPLDFVPGKYTVAVSDPSNNIRGMAFVSVSAGGWQRWLWSSSPALCVCVCVGEGGRERERERESERKRGIEGDRERV
jgi:hypothetical protein